MKTKSKQKTNPTFNRAASRIQIMMMRVMLVLIHARIVHLVHIRRSGSASRSRRHRPARSARVQARIRRGGRARSGHTRRIGARFALCVLAGVGARAVAARLGLHCSSSAASSCSGWCLRCLSIYWRWKHLELNHELVALKKTRTNSEFKIEFGYLRLWNLIDRLVLCL